MKEIRKKILFSLEALLLFVVVLVMCNYSLVVYGISQAKGQLNIIYNSKPVEQVLNDPQYPDSLKEKLRLVQEIKQFAFDSLGINYSENYNTFFDQKGKPVLWVVTASQPYKLEDHKWSFPILGDVSYKGFFELDKGKKEAKGLKDQDLDVDIGRVGAWSTLGWFKDPVLSGMLEYSEGALANVIIHELTHGTLYVKSNVDFNENLASFIGDKGALRFLANKYGVESAEYKAYVREKLEEQIIQDYALKSKNKLDSLYNCFPENCEPEVKAAKKKAFMASVVNDLNSIELSNVKRKNRIAKRIEASQNAFFLCFVRYDSQKAKFEREYRTKFNSDIKKYLDHLKKIYPSV